MRFVAVMALCSLTTLIPVPPAHASGIDDKIADPQELAALESKASLAGPREQCFLYAEVVHQMTELAGRQLSAGDFEHATSTLKIVRTYVDKIHMGMANDTKRLKNAEILVRHTAFRLQELLSNAGVDDKPTVQATLTQLDSVQSELMQQVFKH